MTIFNTGGANPAAFGVPGLYVNVQPPPAAPLPGAPSDILGIVGSASWGPVNVPVGFGDEGGGSVVFGAMKARKFDGMTQVHAAQMNGARNFRFVRATDGTDTAASVVVQTNGMTLTGKYTGTDGAGIQATIAAGTKASTKKVTLTMPGKVPETFDNIVATAASNASWVAIVAAINAGIGTQGASQLVVATVGASTTSPTNATVSLAGGNDGAAVAATNLVGADTTPRTGMYALRNTGAAVFILADVDDSTAWSAQAAFAVSESAYVFGVSPSGDTIANFATTMASAGVDTPWMKIILGDWVYMLDGVNNTVRLVSPQGFLAGLKVAYGPHQSTLNKPLQGISGTQSSYAQKVYSPAELQLIGQARGDVIVMNSPGGDYPSAAFGRNSSSDTARRQDTYTTMTNYLARSFDQRAGLGAFVGRLITLDEMREAAASLGGFLQLEWDDGRIGNAQGTLPYSVQIDALNNPQIRIAQGVQKATVMVQYFSVLEVFLVDLTGGQTVQIASAQALQQAA